MGFLAVQRAAHHGGRAAFGEEAARLVAINADEEARLFELRDTYDTAEQARKEEEERKERERVAAIRQRIATIKNLPVDSTADNAETLDATLTDLRAYEITFEDFAEFQDEANQARNESIETLDRMLAMRAYQRAKHVDGSANHAAIDQVKLSVNQVEEMYRVMAIANYEDRFVIPTTHREYAENAFNVRGGCGFSFGNGCSEGVTETSLFGSEKKRTIPIKANV